MPATASGTSLGLPPEFSSLLATADAAARERAWAAFLAAHNPLLLHVARSVGHDYDAAMDAYAFLLEQLRCDDFHRLRTYQPDGRTKFTTWLVVVSRRLCVDFARRRYGRFRSSTATTAAQRTVRRRLTDLIAADLDVSSLGQPDGAGNPERDLIEHEQTGRLAAAVAQLDVADQLLLKLRFDDDRTMEQIAGIMGFTSRIQVHRHLKAVLGRLRTAITAPGEPGSVA